MLVALALASSRCVAKTVPTTAPAGDIADQAVIDVRRYVLDGDIRAFRREELQAVVAPFAGPGKTFEDLDAARVAITKKYVDAGFVNSGATLPDQDFDPAIGSVTLRVVEGKLDRAIVVEGLDGRRLRLRKSFVADRLRRAASPVLNRQTLGEALERVRQNPNVGRVVAELEPTDDPGVARLRVGIAETRPVRLGLQFDNGRPPSVGPDELTASLATSDLTGNGDSLFLNYTILRGGWDGGRYDLDFAKDDVFSVNYNLPITASDTTLQLGFSRSDELVTEAQFAELDINTRSTNYDASVRQPLVRRRTFEGGNTEGASRDEELGATLGLTHRQSESFLLGEPFDFSDGSRDGTARTTTVNLGLDYSRRSLRSALSLSGTAVIGVDLFDATIAGGDAPDGRFFAARGQAQYVRRFGDASDARVILRAVAQVTEDALPSVEQFSIGGAGSVRGYRENRLVRDSGTWGGVEVRVPLLPFESAASLELAPFADAGYGWNVTRDRADGTRVDADDDLLAAVGCGVVWAPNEYFDASVYYGFALTARDGGDDLQDDGVHFSFALHY